MFQLTITESSGGRRHETIIETAALIGKSRECHIRLSGWRIGKEHARVFRTRSGMFIQDLGHFSGTWVNGKRIDQHGPLEHGDEIVLGSYTLNILDQLIETGAERNVAAAVVGEQAVPDEASKPVLGMHEYWSKQIHERLLETIDLRRRDLNSMDDQALRVETEKLIRELLAAETAIPEALDRSRLIHDVLNEAVGLGPLEDLLDDEGITEIMVNRFDEIYLERAGRLERHTSSFTSDGAVLRVIERIVAPLGRRIDESSPMVDARLKDGSRVNAIIPPLAIKGPSLTIRKFARRSPPKTWSAWVRCRMRCRNS